MRRMLLLLLCGGLWALSASADIMYRKNKAASGPIALATDNFDRANSGDLGTNWTVVPTSNAFSIVSNTARPTSFPPDATEYYSGITWPDNQYAQATLISGQTASGTGIGFGVIVRASTTAKTFYRLVGNTTDGSYRLRKYLDGTASLLSEGAGSFAVGDVLRLEVTGGATTTLRMYRNGVQFGGDVTDASSAITSGSAGVAYSSNANAGGLDNWEGGSL